MKFRLGHLLLLFVVASGCLLRQAPRERSSSTHANADALANAAADGGTFGADRAASPELMRAFTLAASADGGTSLAEGDDGFGADDDEAGGEQEETELSGLTEEEEEAAAAVEEEEGESHDEAAVPERDGIRYTAELSDQQLAELWKLSPEKLGTISIGFVDEGRMVNAEQVPEGDSWVVISPDKAYATQETISYVLTAAQEVRSHFPESAPLRVNQLSSREGGYLRPHKSHQNGRDVDLGFYYRNDRMVRVRARERHIDAARNWALVKALVTLTDVQLILVDRRVQKVLYNHALRAGENRAWLDSLFKKGNRSIIRHARRHRDHFHVRFYNARAQELGRRVAPLLALRPEHNQRTHRVRRGDTLGSIARRYGSSINSIKKANRLKSSMLRLSQVLTVPLRGPCTRCPIPPAVILPDRLLPPGMTAPTQLLAKPLPLLTRPDAVSNANADVTGSEGPSLLAAPASAASAESAPSAAGLVVVPASAAASALTAKGGTTVPASASGTESTPHSGRAPPAKETPPRVNQPGSDGLPPRALDRSGTDAEPRRTRPEIPE